MPVSERRYHYAYVIVYRQRKENHSSVDSVMQSAIVTRYV